MKDKEEIRILFESSKGNTCYILIDNKTETEYIGYVRKPSYVVWMGMAGYGFSTMSEAVEYLKSKEYSYYEEWKMTGIKLTTTKETLI